jgi:DNA-directed RNA polymerase subunit omega
MEKIDSKYSLVTLSSKRARDIQKHENQLIAKPVSHKFVGKALEEIHEGILTPVKAEKTEE